MKKTHPVVMLPTIKEASISLFNDGELMLGNYNSKHYDKQHLYILSDEEIKERDCKTVYNVITNKIDNLTWINEFQVGNSDGYPDDKSSFRKIIATTDKSLGIQGCPNHRSLYQNYNQCTGVCKIFYIHESFLPPYIKAYNEGKPITEVDLEYDWEECSCSNMNNTCTHNRKILKTRSDNTVIIRESKKFNNDDLVELVNFVRCYNNKEDSDNIILEQWKKKCASNKIG